MSTSNFETVTPTLRVILPCPSCGLPQMEAKSGDCLLDDGVIVRGVEWLECPECGERLFDPVNANKAASVHWALKKPRTRAKHLHTAKNIF